MTSSNLGPVRLDGTVLAEIVRGLDLSGCFYNWFAFGIFQLVFYEFRQHDN